MNKVRLAVILICLTLYLTGCGTEDNTGHGTDGYGTQNNEIQINRDEASAIREADNASSGKLSGNGSSDSNSGITEGIDWFSGFVLPVPKPDTEYIVSDVSGIFCYEMNEEKLEAYLTELETDGWSCIEELLIEGRINYTYVKEDMIFQVIDHTRLITNTGNSSDDKDGTKAFEDKDTPETSGDIKSEKNISPSEQPASADMALTSQYIIVNLNYGYGKISRREDTLTKPEAVELIQEHINQLTGSDSNAEYEAAAGAKISMILEHFIEDSYEMMELQIFTVFRANGKRIGEYLICHNQILYVIDPLTEVAIADIDGDGINELLSLYGWGSGIYRIELNAYNCSNPVYFNSNTKILRCLYHNIFVPKRGYGKLSLDKISDTEIHLLDHDVRAEEDEGYAGEPEDYGKISPATDGYHLVPEKQEDFPYDQWDNSYNQSLLQSKTSQYDKLKEPPQLHITSGDKEFNYLVARTDWDGETDGNTGGNTEFSELMNKNDLLSFDGIGFWGEFKDTIILDFGETIPDSIIVKDYLIRKDGKQVYSEKVAIEREVKIEGDGKFSFGLAAHMASALSSSMETYKNPSYRGFKVICTFGENKTCQYSFALEMEPVS